MSKALPLDLRNHKGRASGRAAIAVLRGIQCIDESSSVIAGQKQGALLVS